MSEVSNIWGTFEVDEKTGLPVAPEGLRWRFRKSSPLFSRIELIKGNRFFPTVVEWTALCSAEFSEELLLTDACYVLKKYQEFGPRVEEPPLRDIKSYYGTYPPKRLTRDTK